MPACNTALEVWEFEKNQFSIDFAKWGVTSYKGRRKQTEKDKGAPMLRAVRSCVLLEQNNPSSNWQR